MKMEDRQASRIHYNMALIGGFLGAYGVVSRGNFPSAQTGNMISILTMAIGGGLKLLVNYILVGMESVGIGRKPLDFLIHVGALVVYVAAIVLCTWLPKHAKIRLPQLSLAVSSIAAVLMTMIPMNADPILSLYPLFFATAFQWCSFKGARGFTCATIFSTNNLRQFSSAAVEVWLNHDDSFLDKFKFFGGTLLSFHTGAAAAIFLTLAFEEKASLFCLLPLAAAWAQVETALHRAAAHQTA